MRKLMWFCASLCAMAFVVPAQAQTLAWVSSTGTNTGTTCSQAAPCATFQYAISNVSGVTQINCLNSGNYGPVTITSALIIDCGDGNVGEIASTVSNAAISINTSSAVIIVLRHLSLNGGDGTNINGINTLAFPGGTLIVEHCVINGYHGTGANNGSGIFFAPSSGRGLLQVSDSLLFDNSNNAINIDPASGVIASATLNRDEFTDNGSGVAMNGSGVVAGTMRESIAAESGFFGVVSTASQVFFTIEESSVIDNLNSGIKTLSSGTIINVGASTIGGNGIGVNPVSGSIISFGNNQMSANGTNGSFTGTTPLQ